MKIDVLDKGFIEKMMCADSDLTVVNCARVSFGKESELEWQCTQCPSGSDYEMDDNGKMCRKGCDIEFNLSERDTKLIQYLARENHWSPFAHPQIRLRVKAPIFVRTQLFKHKTGAVENEVSRRYVDDDPEFYQPEVWRGRPDKSIKQGSEGEVDNLNLTYFPFTNDKPDLGKPSRILGPKSVWEEQYNKQVSKWYEELLSSGVAPEQARMVLPQSTYTEWVWTGSLAFFARVYNQRSDPHAQWEAQQYAKAIGEIVAPLFPVSWAALTGTPKES